MTVATMITLLRVAFVPVYMLLMYLSGGETNGWMIGGLAVFIVASITDFVDGYVARKFSQITDFGKFLDPLADKLLVISAMVMFCQWGKMPGWTLMVVLTREFAVTGLRLAAVGKGSVIAAAWSGKVKTACTMVGLCFWMAFPDCVVIGQIVTAVIVLTTLFSGAEYFIKNWKCLKN